jgi:uncharacterized protein with PIN domain
MRPKFIVDVNVGRLARWLRVMGYDTLFFNDIDDGTLVSIGLRDRRVVLTKDTQITLRRAVTSGKLKALLIKDDDAKTQLRQVVEVFNLNRRLQFTRCLECNEPLVPRRKDEVRDLVPPYVFQTQSRYVQCPACNRIYWRGTHWQRMNNELEMFEEAADAT